MLHGTAHYKAFSRYWKTLLLNEYAAYLNRPPNLKTNPID